MRYNFLSSYLGIGKRGNDKIEFRIDSFSPEDQLEQDDEKPFERSTPVEFLLNFQDDEAVLSLPIPQTKNHLFFFEQENSLDLRLFIEPLQKSHFVNRRKKSGKNLEENSYFRIPEDKSLATMMIKNRVQWGDPVYIRIVKELHRLELWVSPKYSDKYVMVKAYPIISMSGKLGPKKKEGDRQAPEGFYYTNFSKLNPNSHYHLAFNVGYPNQYDRDHHYTGGMIMIHGAAASVGCFAMGDMAIEEIYSLVKAYLGGNKSSEVPIQIFPFVPTARRLEKERLNPSYRFWVHLAQAWTWTQNHHRPYPKELQYSGLE